MTSRHGVREHPRACWSALRASRNISAHISLDYHFEIESWGCIDPHNYFLFALKRIWRRTWDTCMKGSLPTPNHAIDTHDKHRGVKSHCFVTIEAWHEAKKQNIWRSSRLCVHQSNNLTSNITDSFILVKSPLANSWILQFKHSLNRFA